MNQRSAERAPDDDEDDTVTTSAGDTAPAVIDADPDDDATDAEQEKLEARARRLGWVPEDEWRGKPDAWVPASQFLDRALSNRAMFEERLEAVERRYGAEIADLNSRLKESGEVLVEINERFKRADQVAYERARRHLEEEMEAAVAEADTERYRTAKDRLETLKPPEPAPKAEEPEPGDGTGKPGKPPHPIVTEWVTENPWFNRDFVLKQTAEAIHVELLKTHPQMSLRENLDEVTRQVKERFPDRFDNPRRRAPSTATPPSGDRDASRKKPGRSYDDLPPEAKAACDKFKRTIPGYTTEDYLRDYEWT